MARKKISEVARQSKTGQSQKITSALVPSTIIRTEAVTTKFPVHILSQKKFDPIEIEVRDEKGELVRKWSVSYNQKFGPARLAAYAVDKLVIDKRIDEHPKPLPPLLRIGSVAEICKELGLEGGGAGRKKLKEALQQNATATINAYLSYKDKNGIKGSLDATFSRYNVFMTGQKLPDETVADAVYISINEPYLSLLNKAPFRPLDYEYLKKLPPLAQRVYEIISFQIYAAIKYKHPYGRIRYSELCMYMARKRWTDIDDIRSNFHRIHKPHIESKYLAKVEFVQTDSMDELPDWEVRYYPGPKAYAEYAYFNQKELLFAGIVNNEKDEKENEDESEKPHQGRYKKQAEQLVKYFHSVVRKISDHKPRPKELEQAEELLNTHGPKVATKIVSQMAELCRKNNFKNVQHFGGGLVFLDEILLNLQKEEKFSENREREKLEELQELLVMQYAEKWSIEKMQYLSKQDSAILTEMANHHINQVKPDHKKNVSPEIYSKILNDKIISLLYNLYLDNYEEGFDIERIFLEFIEKEGILGKF